MIEAGWLILVLWFALLGLSLSAKDRLLRFVAGFTGILFSLMLLGDSYAMLVWVGVGTLMLNIGLIIASIFD